MSSVKIALHLLQDSDIEKMLNKDIMMPFQFDKADTVELCRYNLWKSIEKKVVKKLPLLPPSLPTEVAKFIRPMYYEVIIWLGEHDLLPEKRKGICISFMSWLCWKSNGMIDRVETAKKFVQTGSVDIRDRFIVACNYCLKDEILGLWDTMKKVGINITSRRRINSAVRLWMNLLKEGNTELMNEMIEEYFRIKCFAKSEIPLRLSSYFRYLPLKCRQDYFAVLCCGPLHKDDLYLCLFQMDERERMELFQKMPALIVARCLEWPFQPLFIKMANEVSRYLTLADFKEIFRLMLLYSYIQFGCDYYELSTEFESIVPDSYKDEIIDKYIESMRKCSRLFK
ncbi:hypothetical protein AVEN_160382-1 [Araneus ventricosus]|uniref:Uncharacterized protein n=1 Tax=Araneus ventricosus TaxID=182803 RepID=A0A4Y2L877_ARAVE|nr:hypothetical protein AVEN_160382-1 [Araneus ventricosus]